MPGVLGDGVRSIMGSRQLVDNSVGLSEDAALREIVAGVESETGDRFFYSLVKHLASAFECQYAFASELLGDVRGFGRVRFGDAEVSWTTSRSRSTVLRAKRS